MRGSFSVTLEVDISRENDMYLAICENLGVGSQGDTEKEAVENFKEAATLFFETAIEMGTIFQILKKCGLEVVNSKPKRSKKSPNEYKIEIPFGPGSNQTVCHA